MLMGEVGLQCQSPKYKKHGHLHNSKQYRHLPRLWAPMRMQRSNICALHLTETVFRLIPIPPRIDLYEAVFFEDE